MTTMTPDSILSSCEKTNMKRRSNLIPSKCTPSSKSIRKNILSSLRVFDDGHLLQLLVFYSLHLEPNGKFCPREKRLLIRSGHQVKESTADLSCLLHLLNKELDVPGFGMDEMAGVVFYRLMLPTPKKKIDEELLVAYLKTAEHVCQMFSTPIEAVSSGQMTLDQILAKAHELEKKSS